MSTQDIAKNLFDAIVPLVENVGMTTEKVKSIETTLNHYSATPGYCVALLYIIHQKEVKAAIRQEAAILLKNHVAKYWPTQNPPYAPLSQERDQIRKMLMVLFDEADFNIQLLISRIIAQIAVLDYPEEWKDLITTLTAQAGTPQGPTSTASVNALRTLDIVYEELKDSLSDSQTPIQQDVLSLVLNLLKTIQTLPPEYIVPTLSLCESIIHAAGNSETRSKKTEKKQMFAQFAKNLLVVSTQLIAAPQKGDNFVVKYHAIQLCTEIFNTFQKLCSKEKDFAALVVQMRMSLESCVGLYQKTYIAPPAFFISADSAGGGAIQWQAVSQPSHNVKAFVSLERYLSAILVFFMQPLEHSAFHPLMLQQWSMFPSLVRLAQISYEWQEKWKAAPGDYIEDDAGDFTASNLRTVVLEFVDALLDSISIEAGEASPVAQQPREIFEYVMLACEKMLAESVQLREKKQAEWWLLHEATLAVSLRVIQNRIEGYEDDDGTDAMVSSILYGTPALASAPAAGERGADPPGVKNGFKVLEFVQKFCTFFPGIQGAKHGCPLLCAMMLRCAARLSPAFTPEQTAFFLKLCVDFIIPPRPAPGAPAQEPASELVRYQAESALGTICTYSKAATLVPYVEPLLRVFLDEMKVEMLSDAEADSVLSALIEVMKVGGTQLCPRAAQLCRFVLAFFDSFHTNCFLVGQLDECCELLLAVNVPQMGRVVQEALWPGLFDRLQKLVAQRQQRAALEKARGAMTAQEFEAQLVQLRSQQGAQYEDGVSQVLFSCIRQSIASKHSVGVLPEAAYSPPGVARLLGIVLSTPTLLPEDAVAQALATDILGVLVRKIPALFDAPSLAGALTFVGAMLASVDKFSDDLHLGELVTSLVRGFGAQLRAQGQLETLEDLMLDKYISMGDNHCVTESIFAFLCFVIRSNPPEVLRLLSKNLPSSGVALPAGAAPPAQQVQVQVNKFLTITCNLLPDLKGDFTIKASLDAMLKLLQTGSPLIATALVQGDPKPTDRPLTRSQAKSHRQEYTIIPFLTKLLKISINTWNEDAINQGKIPASQLRKFKSLAKGAGELGDDSEEEEDDEDIDDYIKQLGGHPDGDIDTGYSQTDQDADIKADPINKVKAGEICVTIAQIVLDQYKKIGRDVRGDLLKMETEILNQMMNSPLPATQ